MKFLVNEEIVEVVGYVAIAHEVMAIVKQEAGTVKAVPINTLKGVQSGQHAKRMDADSGTDTDSGHGSADKKAEGRKGILRGR